MYKGNGYIYIKFSFSKNSIRNGYYFISILIKKPTDLPNSCHKNHNRGNFSMLLWQNENHIFLSYYSHFLPYKRVC